MGLGVDATLEKLLDKGHKEEFSTCVRLFLGAGNEREKKVFAMRLRHLASKSRFNELLQLSEVRSAASMSSSPVNILAQVQIKPVHT